MGNRGGNLDKTRGGLVVVGIPSWKEEQCTWSVRRSVENRKKKKKGKKSSCLARVDGWPQRQDDDDDHHGVFEATP